MLEVIEMNVLSMFDGISGCRLAAEKAGLKVDNYFASEIDKYAIKCTQHNYPDTIQLGSVTQYDSWDLNKLDLITAGSPCQDLSRIKKDGKGLQGDKSSLFFSYYNALEKFNPDYFLLENVVMNKQDESIITKLLGVEPIIIDSGDFSAQNRPRLYWTNIPFEKEWEKSELVINDILQPIEEVEEKYFYNEELEFAVGHEKRVYGTLNKRYPNGKRRLTDTTSRVYSPYHKCGTLTAVCGGHQEKKVIQEGRIRKLTPLEYERLQCVPENYTAMLSDSQRYKTLGNGWTVDVVSHILGGLK